ncbi:MAG: metal-binding protein [Leptolyngbyaceae bacterium]|nr:metal-binding protein [Leptolyngbyaceae bacterium]
MPSGYTHDRITLWSLPLVATLSFIRTRNSTLTLLLLAGFLFGALMLGPDLDTRSIHFKRWGPLRWIWIPYRGSLRHRSPLSHWPLVGTVVRVVYVLAWAFILCVGSLALINEVFQMGWTWNDISSLIGRSLHTHQSAWIAVGIGLEVGALSHYLADWGVSTSKRVRRHYPKEGLWALRRILNPSPKKPSTKKPSRRKRTKGRSPSTSPSTSSSKDSPKR